MRGVKCAKCKRTVERKWYRLGTACYGKNHLHICKSCHDKWMKVYEKKLSMLPQYGEEYTKIWKMVFEKWLDVVEPEKVVFT